MYTLSTTPQHANRKSAAQRHSHLKRLALTAIPASFMAAIGISSLPAAAAPATLTGTFINAADDANRNVGFDPAFVCPPTSGQDNAGGFTASYSVRTAIFEGPYAGDTYIENGTVTVGTEYDARSNEFYVTAQNSSFRIQTGGGATIRGTRTLAPNTPNSTGSCNGSNVILSFQSTYTMTVDDGGTRFVDRGLSGSNVFGDINTTSNNFTAAFSSDLNTPNNIGQVTGSGSYGDKTSFRFNARSTKKAAKASCVIRDRSVVPAIVVRCVDAISYVDSRPSNGIITVRGNATVNDQPTTYELQILDNTANGDIFGLSLGTGYTRSGVVTDGSIDVLR